MPLREACARSILYPVKGRQRTANGHGQVHAEALFALPEAKTGLPAKFVPLSKAYAQVSMLELDTIEKMASGQWPDGWPHGWCFTYLVAARTWISQFHRPNPNILAEIADRTEGKVPQRVYQDTNIRGVVAVPAEVLTTGDWIRQADVVRSLTEASGRPVDEEHQIIEGRVLAGGGK